MPSKERNGQRQSRDLRIRRLPRLGYYLIFTDTRETEKNYLEGLKQFLPVEIRDNIVIKVKKTSTDNLIQACLNDRSIDPQFRETWIIFDRDQVHNFDKIIKEAEDNDINVAWSNPCLEIWFSAYFGKMPNCENSTKCLDLFKNVFKQKTCMRYEKEDTKIYKKLIEFGNESTAIKIAQQKHQFFYDANKNCKPSEMYPCTTLFKLVAEIKGKDVGYS